MYFNSFNRAVRKSRKELFRQRSSKALKMLTFIPPKKSSNQRNILQSSPQPKHNDELNGYRFVKFHHLNLSTEKLGFFCVCGFKAEDRKILIDHIAEFSGQQKFECNVCYQKFRYLANLYNHQKSVHKVVKIISSFGCHYCGKEFLARPQMLNHIILSHYTGVEAITVISLLFQPRQPATTATKTISPYHIPTVRR